MKEIEEYVNMCRRKFPFPEQAEVEEIVRFMRDQNLSKSESLLTLKRLLSVSGIEAKKIVHFSETWEAEKEGDDAFHDKIEEVMNEEEE